ncbi:MAG TPA: ChaN family lipoprotein [Gammaproteobacteria bacterium]|jgi:uncharacterized iron-regulated protein
MTIRASIGLISLLMLLPPQLPADDSTGSCDHHIAQWLDPRSGKVLQGEQLFERLAKANIVLLGEAHTTAAHHRWQAYMLGALHSRRNDMMVGFEMVPRRLQSVLDDWTAGQLSEDDFLEQVEWEKVWGYDAGYYLPLFHFARLNRLPAIGLNVDRSLVSRVAREGWESIDAADRDGLSDPAPASEAYREALARLYGYKQSLRAAEDEGGAGHGEIDLEEIRNSDEFANFLAAQQTWDRGMAETLATAHRINPSALVVGIIGRGHLEYGYGIPHQLADLGIDGVEVLIPLNTKDTCDPLNPEFASAVFVVDAEDVAESPPGPRLGVFIENADSGVRIKEIIEDSVAEASGLLADDIILRAADFETTTTAELIEVVKRQAPGTWLPLNIRRGDEELQLIAKFPQRFE